MSQALAKHCMSGCHQSKQDTAMETEQLDVQLAQQDTAMETKQLDVELAQQDTSMETEQLDVELALPPEHLALGRGSRQPWLG